MASEPATEGGRTAGGRDSSRLRSWVAELALTAFGAGGLSGVLVERSRHASEPLADGPFHDYRTLFEEHFQLTPERQRLFGQVVRHYQRELDEVRQRALEDSMDSLEPDLISLGLRYRDLIRNHVLPESDRAEFDRLAQAKPLSSQTDLP